MGRKTTRAKLWELKVRLKPATLRPREKDGAYKEHFFLDLVEGWVETSKNVVS